MEEWEEVRGKELDVYILLPLLFNIKDGSREEMGHSQPCGKADSLAETVPGQGSRLHSSILPHSIYRSMPPIKDIALILSLATITYLAPSRSPLLVCSVPIIKQPTPPYALKRDDMCMIHMTVHLHPFLGLPFGNAATYSSVEKKKYSEHVYIMKGRERPCWRDAVDSSSLEPDDKAKHDSNKCN